MIGRRDAAPVPSDRGSVLLETAFAIPILVATCAIAMWVIALGHDHVQVSDAALVGVRAAARGDAEEAVRAAVLARAPGSTVDIVVDAGVVTVSVSRQSAPGLPVLAGLGLAVESSASAALEAVVVDGSALP